MKQILQNLKSGKTSIEDIPCPKVKPGHILIKTNVSLISVGTERMLVEFGKANIISKAKQQPDKVRMVVNKMKSDGIVQTYNTVSSKLDTPLPLGYCNVGEIIEIGDGVSQFRIGDRVASNGNHAEIINVPEKLCAKIPDKVSNNEASFTVIAAIALQGIRLINPTLGETIVVTGLGLIGLITIQLLKANGCRVLGLDFDQEKLDIAKQFGAEVIDVSKQDPVESSQSFSKSNGVDGVIITASTKSNEPVHQAALMCRKRGRIVLVGVTGLELSRADFFEKELTFQVSCSYGPGRYDPIYELKGVDYPLGFVRWTEKRNFEAVLDMLAEQKLNFRSLISHKFDLDDAINAYQLVSSNLPSLGILLIYKSANHDIRNDLCETLVAISSPGTIPSEVSIGFIGSGNYATQVIIPAFSKTSARLKYVASCGGVSAVHAAKKYKIEYSTTDANRVISDNDINAVVITTRHNLHAGFVTDALKAGKHVFVEKPLVLTRAELHDLDIAYQDIQRTCQAPILMVGFNRRFSPLVKKIKDYIQLQKHPLTMVMIVNAGYIPANHWTQDKSIGGGRIIGEACHFVDLLRYIANSPIVSTKSSKIGEFNSNEITNDKVTFTLEFENGSMGTVHYFANGHKSYAKEKLEIFCGGRILRLDNFRKLSGYGWKGFKKMRLWQQNKGNCECVANFVDAIKTGKQSPIPYVELLEVSKVTFDIWEALQS